VNRADRELLAELGRMNRAIAAFGLESLNGVDGMPRADVRELGKWLVRMGSALQERARAAETVDGVVIDPERRQPPPAVQGADIPPAERP
jgi:hypothetical protein